MALSKYASILTADFLQSEHVEKRKSATAIAREIGCDPSTVCSYLHFHNIPQSFYGRMGRHGMWKGFGDISATQFSNIRNNAKIRGIEFGVTIEELWNLYQRQNGRCALSGREIGFVHCKRGNASLDRIKSTEPYVIDNLWWVHKDVNLAKQSLTVEEFISLCNDVSEHALEGITLQ